MDRATRFGSDGGMRRQAVAVAVGTAAVLLLGLAVSASDPVWFVRGGESSGEELPPGLREGGADTTSTSTAAESNHQVGTWFSIVSTVVLGAFVLLILLALFHRARERRSRRRREEGRTADTGTPFDKVTSETLEVPLELLEATDTLSALLAEGSPRNAIVNCWIALEVACASAGAPRQSAETSVEFTTRVVGTFSMSASGIDALAALYREARFSTHPLTEQHRSAAVDALRQVQEQLRAGRPERTDVAP